MSDFILKLVDLAWNHHHHHQCLASVFPCTHGSDVSPKIFLLHNCLFWASSTLKPKSFMYLLTHYLYQGNISVKLNQRKQLHQLTIQLVSICISVFVICVFYSLALVYFLCSSR